MKYTHYSMSDTTIKPEEVGKITVKLKHKDWEIEITCDETKVKNVVENVLSGMDVNTNVIDEDNFKEYILKLENHVMELESKIQILENHNLGINHQERRSVQKIGMTCRSVLNILILDNFFDQEKPLAQVHEEISRRGYSYDRTAVSHSLTDMVRERILTRVGTMRNYRYIQKNQNAT